MPAGIEGKPSGEADALRCMLWRAVLATQQLALGRAPCRHGVRPVGLTHKPYHGPLDLPRAALPSHSSPTDLPKPAGHAFTKRVALPSQARVSISFCCFIPYGCPIGGPDWIACALPACVVVAWLQVLHDSLAPKRFPRGPRMPAARQDSPAPGGSEGAVRGSPAAAALRG